MPVSIVRYPTRSAQADGLAEAVGEALREALVERSQASVAVPGGRTPVAFFDALSRIDLDWARVTVLPTDERCVAQSDERSNAGMIRRTLLRNRAADARLLPLHRPAGGAETDVGEVDCEIRHVLPLDVCVLGMGSDLHTASLFADGSRIADALSEDTDGFVLPMSVAGVEEPRVTLTAAALRGAGQLHLLIAGADKEEALQTALAGDDWLEAPVRAVLSSRQGIRVHYAD